MEIKQKFRRYGLKKSSIATYTRALNRFCKKTNLTFEDLITKDLETIEDITESFIRENEGILSPKYLNIVYSAIKGWLARARKS